MTDKLYVLRVVKHDMTSRDSFVYPESGPVECPDWVDNDLCGGGLHGWLWGAGDLGSCGYWSVEGAKWLVIEVDAENLRHGSGALLGKCKFSKGEVVFCGPRYEAVKFITSRAPAGTPILFGTATAGDYGTATAGDYGTATAGYDGTATAGDYGTATAGRRGTATAGYGGTATAGDYGTATAGNDGTATAGYDGTATAGEGGTATAGYGGIIQIKHWDGNRCHLVTGYVGENGIEANVPYALVDGAFKRKS